MMFVSSLDFSILFGDNNDENDEEEREGNDSGFSLKCNSPKISVKVDSSMGLEDLIWFQEESDSRSVGFSGNGFSKICWRLPQAAMGGGCVCCCRRRRGRR